MTNLFSIFDPKIYFLPRGWMSVFAVFSLTPVTYWTTSSRPLSLLQILIKFLLKEIKSLFSPWASRGQILIYLRVFCLILIFNAWGLFPFVFTPSSHPAITLAISLPLWLGHMLAVLYWSPWARAAHLVPSGAPGILGPLIVIIELVRRIIRPFTLAVRLAANIIAGHLLLSLLASSLDLSLSPLIFLTFRALLTLLRLELGVALIQAYVFSMLSCLYIQETESPKIHLNN